MKVIRGGTVVTAADATLADVLIDGETIAEVGTSATSTPRSSMPPAASCCPAPSTRTRT